MYLSYVLLYIVLLKNILFENNFNLMKSYKHVQGIAVYFLAFVRLFILLFTFIPLPCHLK